MSNEDEQVAIALTGMGFHRDDVKWAMRVAAAEAEVERLQQVIRAARGVAQSWPDGDERTSDYAAARGQCKRAILAVLPD